MICSTSPKALGCRFIKFRHSFSSAITMYTSLQATFPTKSFSETAPWCISIKSIYKTVPRPPPALANCHLRTWRYYSGSRCPRREIPRSSLQTASWTGCVWRAHTPPSAWLQSACSPGDHTSISWRQT